MLLHLAYNILEHRMIVNLVHKNIVIIILHQYLPHPSQLHLLQSCSVQLVLTCLDPYRGLLPLLH